MILGNNDFMKIWNNGTNANYYLESTIDILKALNDITNGLYHIADNYDYIFHTLNTTIDVQKEVVKILNSVDTDLATVAEKFAMVKSLLFGDAFDWNYILKKLEEVNKQSK